MSEKNTIIFSFEESREKYSAELIPLKRKTIYGERKVIAVDKENNECSRILYDESDMTLFPKKSIGTCRLDAEGKLYSGREDRNEKTESDYGDYWKNSDSLREVPADSRFLLPDEAKAVYTLEGGDTLIVLNRIGEKIFRYKNRDLVFQRNGKVFWIKPVDGMQPGDFAEKSVGYQPDDQPIVSDITDLDDINFDMF